MVSIPAPQPICHKAMAAKIGIFTRAAIAIAAIKKSNSATAGLQCIHQQPQHPNAKNWLNRIFPSVFGHGFSFTKSVINIKNSTKRLQ